MAQNDMEVIMYKILRYLYECMKTGKRPDLLAFTRGGKQDRIKHDHDRDGVLPVISGLAFRDLRPGELFGNGLPFATEHKADLPGHGRRIAECAVRRHCDRDGPVRAGCRVCRIAGRHAGRDRRLCQRARFSGRALVSSEGNRDGHAFTRGGKQDRIKPKDPIQRKIAIHDWELHKQKNAEEAAIEIEAWRRLYG